MTYITHATHTQTQTHHNTDHIHNMRTMQIRHNIHDRTLHMYRNRMQNTSPYRNITEKNTTQHDNTATQDNATEQKHKVS